jgi:hypothetical protein
MANIAEVMRFLIPEGGWATTGDDFEGVQFIEAKPITKAQFDKGIAEYDAWKAEQDAKAAADKAALLAKLGISVEEAKLLLS